MDEKPFSLDDELTAEDLAVILAFDEQDELAVADGQDEHASLRINSASLLLENKGFAIDDPDDMMILFASEADADIGTMRRALQQVAQDNQANSPGLISLLALALYQTSCCHSSMSLLVGVMLAPSQLFFRCT